MFDLDNLEIMYLECEKCGVIADDGGWNNNQFFCHECLNQKKEE